MERVDRPREKLLKSGAASLRNEELLAILLGTGTRGKDVLALSRELLKKFKGKKLLKASLGELNSAKGVGLAKACTLLAAIEFSSRLLLDGESGGIPSVEKPEDVLAYAQEIRSRKKENFVVLYLNARNQLIYKEFVSIGTLNAAVVHPREVFAPALERSSAGVVLIHNHPSGDCTPSQEDLDLTRRLVAAGELLGIMVLDHLIVSPTGFLSMKEKKYM